MLRPRAPPPLLHPREGVAVGPLLGAGRELIGLELCGSTSLGTGRVGEGCSRLCDGPAVSPALQPRPDPASPCTRTSPASRVWGGRPSIR